LPAEEVARIGADIADALYLAHRRGVVHRDVKPGNILLGPDGRAKLVDFGIAHSLAIGAERLTTTGMVIGTLHSMAPEQLLGGSITPRTDLYGLGAVLYEALTGRPPYAESTPFAVIEAQKHGPPELPGVPPALARVIAACLQADPAQRPIHAGAVASALRSWLSADGDAPALGIAPRSPDVDTAAQTQVRPAAPPVAPSPNDEPPMAVDAGANGPPAPSSAAASSEPPRRSILPMSMVALVLAALLLVAILSSTLLRPDAAGDPGTTATPTPSQVPVPTPTPSFDIGALPRPVAEEVRKWWEDCGTEGQPPPVDISGMNHRQVEDALKPFREACEGDD
jgi:serine/threonine protein kinase